MPKTLLRRPAWTVALWAQALGLLVGLAGCPQDRSSGDKPRGNSAASANSASDNTASANAAGAQSSGPSKPAKDQPPINVDRISFAGPAGHRPDASFSPGETIFCLFTATHFTYQKRQAHLVADIRVVGVDGTVVLREPQLTLLKGPAPSLTPGSLRSSANLTINPATPPGKYTVQLTLRDLLGRREGSGSASFTVMGPPQPSSSELALARLRWVAQGEAQAPAVHPIAFWVTGFKTKPAPQKEHTVNLAVRSTIKDASGAVRARHSQTLLKKTLPFVPQAFPAEYQLDLPKSLTPGSYQVELEITDHAAGAQSKNPDHPKDREKEANGHPRVAAQLPLTVVPGRLDVVSFHIHDAAHLPRTTFLLGEQVFFRCAVTGFATRDSQARLELDLAIAGPDGGVYLARKNAASVEGARSEGVVKTGRFPVQVPLVLPRLAPTGQYRVVIRARDLWAKKEVIEEHTLSLRGWAPKPMSRFQVDELEVRRRPDLPPEKGDTFRAGNTYLLHLSLGGVKPPAPAPPKPLYQVAIKGSLRLRNLRGDLVQEKEGLFQLEKQLTYRPLRLLVPARWTVPSTLRTGLYDLEVNVVEENSNRASLFQRRVEIQGLGPAPLVPLPVVPADPANK